MDCVTKVGVFGLFMTMCEVIRKQIRNTRRNSGLLSFSFSHSYGATRFFPHIVICPPYAKFCYMN